jgi:hypothetical protein
MDTGLQFVPISFTQSNDRALEGHKMCSLQTNPCLVLSCLGVATRTVLESKRMLGMFDQFGITFYVSAPIIAELSLL